MEEKFKNILCERESGQKMNETCHCSSDIDMGSF